jgi:N-acetyl-anhydromuramyl-L-alanine amidase AmpD
LLREKLKLNFSYETTGEQLRQIPQIITDIVAKYPEAKLKRVLLDDYTDYSFDWSLD